MRGLVEKEERGGMVGLIAQLLLQLRRANRRFGMTDRQLAVMETLSLGSRRQMMLIRCGEEQFLVGVNARDVQCIVPLSAHTHEHRDEIR